MTSVLEIKNLTVTFDIEGKTLTAADNISARFAAGRSTGIVGESGCGKTVTASSIMRLIPSPPGHISAGEIIFEGKDLLKISLDSMRKIRGKEIAMIFQEPMTALNPVFTVGDQIAEVYKLHFKYSTQEIIHHTHQMLQRVGISSPESSSHRYPHELSGGMRQRVMIAMALACSPKLLIADEPTTALDVTIQAQILDLMRKLKDEKTSIIFITHNLGVVAEMCDDVYVMYGGKIVEAASVEEIFDHPRHPYTYGLLNSIPKPGTPKDKPLSAIKGMLPDFSKPLPACHFADRCPRAQQVCLVQEPRLGPQQDSHQFACHFPMEPT